MSTIDVFVSYLMYWQNERTGTGTGTLNWRLLVVQYDIRFPDVLVRDLDDTDPAVIHWIPLQLVIDPGLRTVVDILKVCISIKTCF